MKENEGVVGFLRYLRDKKTNTVDGTCELAKEGCWGLVAGQTAVEGTAHRLITRE